MSKEKVSRRGYVKYAAAGVVVVAAAGAGAYYATRPRPTPTPIAGFITKDYSKVLAGEETFKAALIIECPSDDFGWGQINHEACDITENYFAERGIDVKIDRSYLVPPPEFDKEGRVYADKGYDLICYPCDGHGPEVGRLAKEYPNQPIFCAASLLEGDLFPVGTPREEMVIPPNLAVLHYVYTVSDHYLRGILAASITKTGKIGFLGGVEYPSIHKLLRGDQQGVQRWVSEMGVPEIDISQYVWVGSWIDVAKGKEMAEAMHEYGCDVICTFAEGPAIGATTYATDVGPPPYIFNAMYPTQTKYPEVVVADSVSNTYPAFIGMIERLIEGRWLEVGGKWSEMGYSATDPFVAEPQGPQINPQLKHLISQDALDLVEKVKFQIFNKEYRVPEIMQ